MVNKMRSVLLCVQGTAYAISDAQVYSPICTNKLIESVIFLRQKTTMMRFLNFFFSLFNGRFLNFVICILTISLYLNVIWTT